MLRQVLLFCCVAASLGAPSAEIKAGKWFDYIFTVIFENHSEREVLKDPNFQKWTNLGRAMLTYHAVTHPSQPNYIAQVGGATLGVLGDKNYNLTENNLVDLMEAGGVSWKTYQEDFPGDCNPASSVGKYYRKHNPFISFDNIRENPDRCALIVDETALDADLAAGALPQFTYFTPNIDNDAHNTNVTFAGKWLDGFLTPRIDKFPAKTLIVVTWDEDDGSEFNKILTFLLEPKGSLFPAGSSDKTRYNHWSWTRTIEENWALGDLGRHDAQATVFDWTA